MMRHRRRTRLAAVLVLPCLLLLSAAKPASDPPPSDPAAEATTASRSRLLEELGRLMDEVDALREALATTRMEATRAQRELEELRQFIHDHEELGADFERYQAVKTIAEREARQREAEANRRRREAARDERARRLQAARARRGQDQAESARLDRYREAGFAHLGLDVFGGRMAFAYQTIESNPTRVDYDPWIGLYYRPGGPSVNVDFSRMTISGSVLNAASEVRNLGVAITFFDEDGNQVGSEIVQINNARPDVPYPFTSAVEMALTRPFASSSTYVLYADPLPE